MFCEICRTIYDNNPTARRGLPAPEKVSTSRAVMKRKGSPYRVLEDGTRLRIESGLRSGNLTVLGAVAGWAVSGAAMFALLDVVDLRWILVPAVVAGGYFVGRTVIRIEIDDRLLVVRSGERGRVKLQLPASEVGELFARQQEIRPGDGVVVGALYVVDRTGKETKIGPGHEVDNILWLEGQIEHHLGVTGSRPIMGESE